MTNGTKATRSHASRTLRSYARRVRGRLHARRGRALGALVDPTARWRIHAYARQLGSLAGERHDPGALVLEQRLTLTRDRALRFDLSRQSESGRTFDTALFSFHLYF